ncbi:uncharacterized protein PV06_00454 [Exophiala oligosperma]|uniref:Uncharacterized protein n=1 Tax=Exophiala oligosperma TaxID=215243 RepID=A0A0D2CD01_9EURO|nr:uncharacterized protein PV06_00454 [Exophiala oligosperma]KIW47792.1 hypothetical protein PV06_00454 [Exophiala oligosperma]
MWQRCEIARILDDFKGWIENSAQVHGQSLAIKFSLTIEPLALSIRRSFGQDIVLGSRLFLNRRLSVLGRGVYDNVVFRYQHRRGPDGRWRYPEVCALTRCLIVCGEMWKGFFVELCG